MKNIVVFGATGNVGSYFVKYASEFFDKNEYNVIASGRRETKVFEQFGVNYISVDINNKNDFKKLPQNNVYAVVLLAAVIPSYMANYSGEKYLETNIMGTYNVLEYCKNISVNRIMFSTTVFDISLYAQHGVELFPNMAPNFSYKGDHAVYVISKNTALELLEHYKQEYGINKFIFRFPTIYEYSPFQYYYPQGIKTMRPLYKMINNAKQGLPLEIWGDPTYSKDMVHVYDCSQMICKAIISNRTEGFYNVGTGIPVSLQEQCDAIIDVFSPKNNRSKILYHPEVANGGGFLMNVDNAKKELGYVPQYDVKKLFEDYKIEMEYDRFKELRIPKEIEMRD